MNQVPLVPCRACCRPISVHATACPACGQPQGWTPMKKAIGLVLVAAGALFGIENALRALHVYDDGGQVYVECAGGALALTEGMSCTIEQRGGSRPANVCWSVDLTCAGDIHSSARTCGGVGANAKTSTTIPPERFSNANRCVTVIGVAVTDVRSL